jgi:toxin HigB-1
LASGVFFINSNILCIFNIYLINILTLDVTNVIRYHYLMIKSFKCKETEKIWSQEISRKLPVSIQKIALRKLFMIQRAKELRDLNIPPSSRLEKLKGVRAFQYSIRINDQYRICFTWRDSDAFEVEIIDYH